MRFDWSLILVALLLSGCGQQDQGAASLREGSMQAEPAEAADAFVSRINEELAELSREGAITGLRKEVRARGALPPVSVLEIVGRLIRKVEESFDFDAEEEDVEDAHPVIDVDEVEVEVVEVETGRGLK